VFLIQILLQHQVLIWLLLRKEMKEHWLEIAKTAVPKKEPAKKAVQKQHSAPNLAKKPVKKDAKKA
jgi:hypothetical protein